MKPKSRDIKRCEICGKETDLLFRCKYCERAVCKDCLTHEKGFGQVCVKCMASVPRQINWDGFELNV